jgi:hypothetical protein
MSVTTSHNIQDRIVGKSVKIAINEIHSEPIWGILEGVINSMTALKNHPPHKRVVCITLRAGRSGNDLYIVDQGTGITNYHFIEKHLGYDIDTKEYQAQQLDPDYLNKMGIGIPSMASLSRDHLVEFRSVFINQKGNPEGLIATYSLADRVGGFVIPAEHPSSTEVFNVDGATADMHTGTWVIIKNAKTYHIDRIYSLLSDVFARKLKDGYHIRLRGSMKDDFRDVLPPQKFCCAHENPIGFVHDDILGDFQVRADIHPVSKAEDSEVRIQMKKMKMGLFSSEYMARGEVNCDCLEFKPDREGLVIDQEDPKYAQLEQLILNEFERLGIEKRPTQALHDVKRSKKWKEKAQEVWARYYNRNGTDSLLRILALKSPDGSPSNNIPGLGQTKLVSRPTKRCANGFHWDNKLKQCVANPPPPETEQEQKEHEEGRKRKPYKKHRKGRKKGQRRKINEEYTEQSIPDFNMARTRDPSRIGVWISETESTIFFNTHYQWAAEAWENATDREMDLLVCMAIMDAVPENRSLSPHEFLLKMARSI